MSQKFKVRLATPDDAETIGRHRARMFQDMGEVPAELFEEFCTRSTRRLREQLTSGEYVGWLASTHTEPEKVVAGAGVQLRQVLPHPGTNKKGDRIISEGRHAIILNVFTEPQWRRRGVATLLLKRIIDWSREEQLDRLVLHASKEGRALYDKLGFTPTNEMRFAGDD